MKNWSAPLTQVPREEWKAFCERISADYEGWQVNVETSCWETCSIYEWARRERLVDIRAEALDTPIQAMITITVGLSTGDRVTHKIGRPSCLQFETASDGRPKMLRIESVDGIVVVIRFHPD